jgi:uncharacterized protein (DUF2141 family)
MKIKTLSATLLLLATAAAHAAEIKVEILGIERAEGQVLVALYDETKFLKAPIKALRLPATVGGITASFTDIPEGNYAIAAVLDENGNGKLDMNAVGMPLERMGFSNDATGFMGPPQFTAAKFELNAAPKALVINLR